MLTGVPPEQSVMQALHDQSAAECFSCLLSPCKVMPPPRLIVEPSSLSQPARGALSAFVHAGASFTIFDARRHSWLLEEDDPDAVDGLVTTPANQAARCPGGAGSGILEFETPIRMGVTQEGAAHGCLVPAPGAAVA